MKYFLEGVSKYFEIQNVASNYVMMCDVETDRKKPPSKYRLEQDTAFNKILSNIGQQHLGTRLPTSGLPNSQIMQSFYAEIFHIWRQYQLPLTPYDDIKHHKSTIPEDFPSGHQGTLSVISTVLLTLLSNNLPTENKLLQDIFAPYRPDSDGFGALYALFVAQLQPSAMNDLTGQMSHIQTILTPVNMLQSSYTR